jgi:DNA repair protein RecN (Recombination protein N)
LASLKSVLSDGHHAVAVQLTQLIRQVESIREVSPHFGSIADRLDQVRLEVQDIAMEASRLDHLSQHDPSKLSKVQSRLGQLYSLIKKYQVKDDNALVGLFESLKKEYNELSSAGESISKIEKKIAQSTENLIQEGASLSKKRKAGSSKIIPKMNKLLKELGMPNGKFAIEINDASYPAPDGTDDIRFMFSANQGIALQPLQSVASGGELSRLSLALKSLYASQANLPTIIFDEIDSGISGEVAWRMGQLIFDLAKGHQIMMITHSPQIAAHAHIQYHVSKVLTKGRDASSVQLLTQEMRFVEIAKMLSGDPPSREALANAKSLVAATGH